MRVAEQALALLIAANRPLHAFVELSGPMPTDGSQAAYGMGLAAGLVRGVLAGLGIPITLIPPVVWKRGMGLTADKGSCRQRAMQLFPARANLFMRAMDDGRADAVALGVYGLRTWQRDAAE